jgi:hypothetical protein
MQYQTQYPGGTAFLTFIDPHIAAFLSRQHILRRTGWRDQVVQCCITQRLRLHSWRKDEFASFGRLLAIREAFPSFSFDLLIFLQNFP